ncbi:amino acid adenylation domain-containing protein [Micromonospora sp. 4G57]|uniref:amino acid adenylation domain-containing protein n=1 Tax=Micromonospora sicca TaxID=2202420 RepID=UPI002ACA5C09|nr:amino acid adenylation domain-containing protein [Micromonospora sp. 4G57]MDZ5442292.1 amino acid adenylation domain-containing protein [Micromonospora sp. 4G57]
MTGPEALTGTRGGPDAGGRDGAAPYAVGPDLEYPEATLADLILAAAARRGPAVAVRQWHEVLSYTELVDRAAALAATLRGHGVGPETRVGICAGRRPELLVAVLGVLLAGGCYVPLDRTHPRRRIREIARDAGLSAAVVDKAGREALADLDLRLVDIPAEPAGTRPAAVACPARPDNAAYVLYTSGSTGRPKGVVVSHRSVVAHVTAFGAYSGADESCRALGFAPLGFDASVQDLFIPLVAGGEIALVPDADRVDPVRLQRFAEAHRVTWGCLPAALLPLLDPDRLPHWRTVFTGIEAPAPEQVERWTGSADRPTRWFSNGYGPTEATVCVTGYLASGPWDGPVPMGRPLANHRIHLVDDDGEPVPPGTPGEVLIGGVGLARGYLGRPALTAEQFVPDPFSGEPGARLYRTGDRAVWLPDRQLLFLGRVDRQVKVRGQRVELGEVEAVLGDHPLVRQAAVVPVDGPAGTELVAVVTPAQSPPDAELVEFLRQRVPDVMVPRRLLRLDELPLTPSGKRDRARLAELAAAGFAAPGPSDGKAAGAAGAGLDATPAGGLDGGADAAGTPDERAVAGAWRRVLGVPAANPADDFFAAGGTSLSAMRLVAALRDELRRDVSVADIFDGRTLGGLAARVAGADRLTEPELLPGQPPTLSPSQRRLWFLDQLAPDSAAYNTAMAERLRGPLDLTALRAALRAVVHRHEVLRWRITRVAGAPHVICDPPGDVPLRVVDLSGMDPAERETELRAWLQAGAATRFDLATGPVWQAELYRLAADEHVLAMTFHHAVFDGWSQAVLYDQLATAYRAARDGTAPLDPLPATYADYAVWRAARDRRHGPDDLAWWTAHLAGAPTVLELNADRVRPAAQTYRGEFASAPFPPELDARVRALAARLGATPSTVLLAAFGEVLRRLLDRTDHVVGVVVADRRLAAVADLVGFFVDIAPVRLRPDGERSFTDQVLACRQELLDVLAHPNAPLERIVQELSVPRDPARPPLVQVLFNVFNFAEPALDLPDLVAERVPAGLPGSPFDLTLYLVERQGVLALDAVYNPDLFAVARIADLLDGYLALLDSLTDAPERPADSVPAPAVLARVQAGAVRSTPPPAPPGRAAVGPAAAAGPVAPTGPTEELVARVWRETLRVDRVGAVDSFFDLGGHSIAMAEVQHRLAEATGREIALVDLFRYPNVRALAAFLDGAENSDGIHLALQRAADRRARARGRQQRRPTGSPGRAEP